MGTRSRSVLSPAPGSSCVLWAVLVALLALPLVAGAKPRTRPPGAAALPESVLARVGAGRVVTAADFERAWGELAPPVRPDSLTPASAAGFLELLIGKECLAERAMSERWVWTAQESLQHAGIRDRLPLQAALDSALADLRRRIGPAADSASDEALGPALRDTFFARRPLTFDEALVARVTQKFRDLPRPRPDSGVMAQIRVLGLVPAVEPGDRPRSLAHGAEGDFTVGELLDSWARLNPLNRPRIEAESQVLDLVRNAILERRLRADARSRGLVARPDIAARIASDSEYVAVQHLVAREVYAKIADDEATLRRHFERNAEFWRLPTFVQVVELVLPNRASASALYAELSDPARAETLVVRAQRQGARYRRLLAAESDSAHFTRCLGTRPGTVLGPDSTRLGWRVTRVEEVLPSRLRRYDEVERLVRQHYYGEEGERRMVDLMASVRKTTPVTIHRAALERLAVRPGGGHSPRGGFSSP